MRKGAKEVTESKVLVRELIPLPPMRLTVGKTRKRIKRKWREEDTIEQSRLLRSPQRRTGGETLVHSRHDVIHPFIQQTLMGSFRGAGTLLALGIQCRMRKRTKSSMGLDSASSAQGGPGLRVRTRGWESEGGKGRSQVRPSRRYKRKQNLDPALRAPMHKRKIKKAELRKSVLGRKVMTNLVSQSANLLSHILFFVTPWTIAHQTPLSMEFSRQDHWRG